MTTRTLEVHLDPVGQVGILRHEARGRRERAAFEYVASWIQARDAYALDPGLPVVSGPQFHSPMRDGSIFHGAIADSEPDGWGKRVMLRDHAKRRDKRKEPLNHLDFLLAVDDFSRVGALRYKDETGVFRRALEAGRTTPPLIELAMLYASSRAVETNAETLADLEYLRGRGTSLGGLRPKCTILDEAGRLAIGKFPSVQDDRAVTRGEVLALRLAKLAGIDAAAARVVDADGTAVAVIDRFDRTPNGARLHYVSAATLMNVDPHDGQDHAYTEVAEAIRIHCADVQRDLEELWRRIAFSILITNVDDHLMNHGFLHRDGHWHISPAFDINPFPDRARELKTWISEDHGPEARIESLLGVRAYFGIKPARARAILGEVSDAVARWRREAKAVGMTATEAERFAPAFEHVERAAAKR